MYREMQQKAEMQSSMNNLARVVDVALRKPDEDKDKKKIKKN